MPYGALPNQQMREGTTPSQRAAYMVVFGVTFKKNFWQQHHNVSAQVETSLTDAPEAAGIGHLL